MKRNKWLLIAAGVLVLAAVGVAVVMALRNPESPVRQSSISLIGNKNEPTEEVIGTLPELLPGETGPSYPVVALDVPPIEEQDTNIRLEAEQANYTGLLSVENFRLGYSGEGYLAGFVNNPGDSVEATCEIEAAQHYDITISVCADSVVTNALVVNGQEIGNFTIEDSGNFVRVTFSGVYLPKGRATFSIKEIDGFFSLDYFEISNYSEMYQMEYRESYKLSNKKASEGAKQLMQYLSEHYGKKVMTGQYAAGTGNTEADTIFRLTGKYPAIRFADLEGYTLNTTVEQMDVISACEAWSARGGIVGLMWHWDAPMGISSVYAEETDFSLVDAMTDKEIALMTQEEIDALYDEAAITEQCYTILRDIDLVSAELKKLAEKDIPVLWRPLHEASGDWFWWGADGPYAYRWLWELLYTRMTEYHGLNNLIWIWNGQSADYLVGNKMYDIASLDIYLPEGADYSSRYEQFVLLSRMTNGQKMLALSETSSVPDMNDMFRDNCIWSFFGLWYGQYLIGEDGAFSEKFTSQKDMVALYNSEAALTLTDTAAHFGMHEEEPTTEQTTETTAETTQKSTETTTERTEDMEQTENTSETSTEETAETE